MGTRRQLVNNLSLNFTDKNFYRVPTGKRGPADGPWNILILGDTFHSPSQVFVLPEIQSVSPGQEIFVQLKCVDIPFYLPQKTPVAQAFLLPKNYVEQIPLNPTVLWTQIMGTNKPMLECSLFCKGERISRPGMLDTGADVTIIAHSQWPANWPLQPVAGIISGIGGVAESMQSKHNVIIEGPEGKLATIRPFVVRAPITVWGRDALSQWGASLRVHCQDF